jgi:hypothetical protein
MLIEGLQSASAAQRIGAAAKLISEAENPVVSWD